MKKIQEMQTSKPFEELPPQNEPLGQQFRDLIDGPIDLKTVRQKLRDQEYKSVIEWGSEMRRVFWGWISFYQNEERERGHPIVQMAMDLQNWFEKKFNAYPRSKNEQWLMKLDKARRKCDKLIQTAPPMELLPEYFECKD